MFLSHPNMQSKRLPFDILFQWSSQYSKVKNLCAGKKPVVQSFLFIYFLRTDGSETYTQDQMFYEVLSTSGCVYQLTNLNQSKQLTSVCATSCRDLMCCINYLIAWL